MQAMQGNRKQQMVSLLITIAGEEVTMNKVPDKDAAMLHHAANDCKQ